MLVVGAFLSVKLFFFLIFQTSCGIPVYSGNFSCKSFLFLLLLKLGWYFLLLSILSHSPLTWIFKIFKTVGLEWLFL